MKLYVDLDGVLTDFVRQCREKQCLKANGKPDWAHIEKAGAAFWTEMEWMPGAERMFAYFRELAEACSFDVEILSAIFLDSGIAGKKIWCRERLGLSDEQIHIVHRSIHKVEFAHGKDSVLIDDRREIVEAFSGAGGTGILHETNEKTELLLKRIAESLCSAR